MMQLKWGLILSIKNAIIAIADVNNGIPIDFGAVKRASVESGQPCRDNIS